MRNPFFRMLLYSIIVLILIYFKLLNFVELIAISIVALIIECIFEYKETNIKTPLRSVGYWTLFLLVTYILFLCRDQVIGK